MTDPRDRSQSEPPAAGGRDAERFWSRYGGREDSISFEPGEAPFEPGEAPFESPPPAGDPRPGGNGSSAHASHAAGEGAGHECLEWCPICRGAEVVRAGASPELREQWQTIQRDALVILRAALDTYLQRLGDDEPRPDTGVEDIRIS